jgi:hypothetical protein
LPTSPTGTAPEGGDIFEGEARAAGHRHAVIETARRHQAADRDSVCFGAEIRATEIELEAEDEALPAHVVAYETSIAPAARIDFVENLPSRHLRLSFERRDLQHLRDDRFCGVREVDARHTGADLAPDIDAGEF